MDFFETSYHHFHGPSSSMLASRTKEYHAEFFTPSSLKSPLWGFSDHPPPGVPGPKYLREDKTAAAAATAGAAAAGAAATGEAVTGAAATEAAATPGSAAGSAAEHVPLTTYGEAFQVRQRVFPVLSYSIQGDENKTHKLQTTTQTNGEEITEPRITRLSPFYKPDPNSSLGVPALYAAAAAAAASTTTPATAAATAAAAASVGVRSGICTAELSNPLFDATLYHDRRYTPLTATTRQQGGSEIDAAAATAPKQSSSSSSSSAASATTRPAGILSLAESLRVFPPKRAAYQRLVHSSQPQII
ncbi:hypothetical protein, conserved [Eimeria acervulina]|uniref:Uncharacterized protein n=1 Tax=Eimeria acervulina TaxID=5801 RepID=U6GAV3_EIMAC|nr:hypothetical protein, conserved [Eimeria acervulina]CDI76637.1 hypothetical protein, conserved [Eimeria acervulina]